MSEITQYQNGTEAEPNDEIMVRTNNGSYVILGVGDEFEHTDDGRTVTIENIRYETPDDKQRADHARRIELSNGNNTGDAQLATALDQGKIDRV
jgi:hypothetical protein